MCLYIRQDTMVVSDHPVTCWKLVEVLPGYSGDVIVTPYAYRKLPKTVLSGKSLFKETKKSISERPSKSWIASTVEDRGSVEISYGFIHTLKPLSLESAESDMDLMAKEILFLTGAYHDGFDYYMGGTESAALGVRNQPVIKAIRLYECEIPAGTPYFEGGCALHNSIDIATMTFRTFGSYASDAIRFTGKFTEFKLEQGITYESQFRKFSNVLRDLAKGKTSHVPRND